MDTKLVFKEEFDLKLFNKYVFGKE